MNPIEAIGIAFWVIVFAVIIGVVASGGWSGLTSWMAAKFGPVGDSSSPGPSGPAQGQYPGTGAPNAPTNTAIPPNLIPGNNNQAGTAGAH